VACNRPAGETKPQDKLVEALSGASADAGSIPAASTLGFQANYGSRQSSRSKAGREAGALGRAGRRCHGLWHRGTRDARSLGRAV